MNKEQFIAIGLTDDLATKAAEASVVELKTYIPKHRFDEVSEEVKTLKGTIKENETALETLKKSTGDAAALTKQIEDLQKDNKTKDETHQAELKEIKLNNAIKVAIAGKVHDEDLVAGLFDKKKLILGDDGKITGLDEQFKGIQETKAFLIKTDTTVTKPTVTTGAQTQQQQTTQQPVTLNDAVKAHYEALNKKG